MKKTIGEYNEDERKEFFILVEQRNLKFRKEVELPSWERIAGKYEGKAEFIHGLIYGLFVGVFGNLAVQFFYPLIEGITLNQYGMSFTVNLTAFLISITLIIITLFLFQRFQGKNKKMIEIAWENINAISLDIRDKETRLEAIRKGLMGIDEFEDKDE